jgi:hypothetical protein
VGTSRVSPLRHHIKERAARPLAGMAPLRCVPDLPLGLSGVTSRSHNGVASPSVTAQVLIAYVWVRRPERRRPKRDEGLAAAALLGGNRPLRRLNLGTAQTSTMQNYL